MADRRIDEHDQRAEVTTEAATVQAWRVFALNPQGILLAPFGPIWWPNASEDLRFWTTATYVAGCVAADHPAQADVPAQDCTCGIRGVVDRDVLLGAANARHIPGAEYQVLADAGVIGKVALSGKTLPGVNIPVDDPSTTLRAEKATVLELHVAPKHSHLAAPVEDRYGVDVLTYDAEGWADLVPERVRATGGYRPLPEPGGEDVFIADVRKAGFGKVDLSNPAAPERMVGVGRKVCKALRECVTLNDVLGGLFDTDARPTFAQVEALTDSAIANLCPECFLAPGPDGYQYAEPVTLQENLRRVGEQALRSASRR